MTDLSAPKRARFVELMKQTPEYKLMKAAEAKMCPTNVRCPTPDPMVSTAKRAWETQACIWRRQIRQYGQTVTDDETKDQMQKKKATEEQLLCFVS